MTLRFDNSQIRALPFAFLRDRPQRPPAPRLVAFNDALAARLGGEGAAAALRAQAAEWFSGAALPPGAEPVALAYAGHQFGGFSPVLGDGRAHLLGEVVAPDGARFDLQLKGSGATPFARRGDGRALLGPMLREYLVSESMAALGVPTTRALAVVATGETVFRDGRPGQGAVLARIAASHIRVGTFQFFAARGEGARLRALADHAIARHDPGLAGVPGRHLAFLDAVVARQVPLVAQWMGLGFVHGVMNTDNMAVSGETLDYGPCAFMEGFAPGTVFSSIDHQGRYSWANQPLILGWNLARLAEAILPLLDDDPEKAAALANERLATIPARYEAAFLALMRAKLGLDGGEPGDGALVESFLGAIAGVDWTLAFRFLADAAGDEPAGLRALFRDSGRDPSPLEAWLPRWRARLAPDAPARMRAVNPAVIPRNRLVEQALAAADSGDMAPFDALLAAVRSPFDEAPGFMAPAPADAPRYVTYCGT